MCPKSSRLSSFSSQELPQTGGTVHLRTDPLWKLSRSHLQVSRIVDSMSPEYSKITMISSHTPLNFRLNTFCDTQTFLAYHIYHKSAINPYKSSFFLDEVPLFWGISHSQADPSRNVLRATLSVTGSPTFSRRPMRHWPPLLGGNCYTRMIGLYRKL